MNEEYRKTQVAWITLGVLAILALPLAIAGAMRHWPTGLTASGVVIAAAALALSTMTIRISAEAVEWYFTFGLFRGNAKFSDIMGVGTIEIGPLSGLGVRTNGRDLLWSVGAPAAVVLELRDRRILLGTPEAEYVAEMIDKRI